MSGERRWAFLANLRADLRFEELYFCSARVLRRRASSSWLVCAGSSTSSIFGIVRVRV